MGIPSTRLELAVSVAKEAGAMLRAEFHRAGGPRGSGESAAIDVEVERFVRARLLAVAPGFGYIGEETGRQAGTGATWIVDPNDGTRDYLKGLRGSAVSIALVQDRRPVLGVALAPLAPDDDGDLLAWEEGAPSVRRASPPGLVLVSPTAEKRATPCLRSLHPRRMRTMPSLSYRLALVAAGEAAAGLGLRGPRDWDYAGAHALLRGAGDVLIDSHGRPVTYADDGTSSAGNVFGGSEAAARDVARIDGEEWPDDGGELPFVRPIPGRAHRDAARLRRAQGCLLGQVAGDALGSLVEFKPPGAIGGARDLADGGPWNTIAGQPTDDSELALALGRTIAACGEYRPDDVLTAYRRWYESGPFDVGATTRQALSGGTPNAESQANGSLMRISPLGVFGWNRPEAVEAARADSRLTHPHPICQEACAAFVAALSHGIVHGDARGAHEAALAAARTEPVRDALRGAAEAPPGDFMSKQGWVLVALRNAFFRLLRSPSFEEGVVDTVQAGGDTDTNAAIAGALLGAVHGREAVPLRWRLAVLSCRPLRGLPGVRQPRPRECWPVDLMELAERLLEL